MGRCAILSLVDIWVFDDTPHTGQTVEHWELVWFVVPQPEQGLEAFDLDFLYAEIRAAELVCWCRWTWSWSANSNASVCLTISSRDFRYSDLVRISVCKVSLCNPRMNWSFTWMDCKSAWQEGHKYSHSWATDFSCTVKFYMDSPSDWDRVAKLRRCTAGLERLVTMVSMVWIISYSLRVKKSPLVWMILFWTKSSQRLYNWAAICDGKMVVSCLNIPLSILNF